MWYDCTSCKYESVNHPRCNICFSLGNKQAEGGWKPKESKDCNTCEDLNCNDCYRSEYEVGEEVPF